MEGDESRYFQFAENILNGYYSPPPPDINLWNGPGYPLFLVPFVYLKLPLITITLANAVLQYLSIILLFHSIKCYTRRNIVLLFSFFWACFYTSYQDLPLILSEPLTSFLSTLLLYFISKVFTQNNNKKYIFYSGLTMGFLVLTKIIFGYVLLALLVISILFFLIKKTNSKKGLILILLMALIVNIPYLAYTYGITHKFFYWGNSGGMSLYWMSTPFEGEYGDWNNPNFTASEEPEPLTQLSTAGMFAKNHQKDMDYINQFVGVEKDEAFKSLAIANIKSQPVKYIRNCIANLGRLFFGFPVSYSYQKDKTLIRLPPNCLIVTLFIICLIPTFLNFKKNIPIVLKFILGIIFSYLFLSMLVSAYPRQLYIIVPLLLFWFAYIIDRCFIFNLKMKDDNSVRITSIS
jgi:4-amino-4-deoxy-L-arabinose transferase-like glycosyltransferase